MVKGMVCSDVALKRVSEGSGQKINQIGIELETSEEDAIETALVRDEEHLN